MAQWSNSDRVTWLHDKAPEYVEVHGTRLRFVRAGAGKPLLLLHTMRMQLDYFHKIFPPLSGNFEVYALDLPGHGHSDMPEIDYTPEFFVKMIEGVLESLDLRDVTVVGESIGAVIALTLAARKNPRIERVWALNPADISDTAGLQRSSLFGKVIVTMARWPFVGWVVVRSQTKWLLRQILRGGLYDRRALSETLLDQLYAIERRPGFPDAERSLFQNADQWLALRKEYAEIRIPVTLVYGSNDWSREKERQDNRRAIPHAEYVVLERVGHFSSLDAPDKIVDLVTRGQPASTRS